MHSYFVHNVLFLYCEIQYPNFVNQYGDKRSQYVILQDRDSSEVILDSKMKLKMQTLVSLTGPYNGP